MSVPDLRQLKDFLQVYNKIAETCFNRCVTSFADRRTSTEEASCTDRCVDKYIGLNHQLMQVYVEIQPMIMQQRIEEMSKLQESSEDINNNPSLGLPASGKSTLAQNIKARYTTSYNVEVITFDKEVSWNGNNSWKNERKTVFNLVLSRIETGLNCLNKPTVIVLDDNMYYRSMRYEYFQLARKYGIGFSQIYLFSYLDNCLLLNGRRDVPVAESTIINMNAKLEAPDSSNYEWEKNSLIVTFPPDENDWINIERYLLQCLKTPVPKLVNSIPNKSHSPNDVHSADITLRRIISSLIKERKGICASVKTYATELANSRVQVLECIRSGEIVLPELNNEEDPLELLNEFLREYLLNCIR